VKRVVCATANAHKVAEIEEICKNIVEILPRPITLGDIDETGNTLEENACIKARAVAVHSGHTALADDTGLEIDALQGEPGVRSARFAGKDANDAANRALVLARLQGVQQRQARFRTVIAIATVDGHCHTVEGQCSGTIASEERGTQGFGYDSIFIPDDGDGRTFAQMTPDEKNKISHRARALLALRDVDFNS
jgi:XTP/dITP diphosphohydrolase